MANIDSAQRNKLYTQAKHLLGAPLRGIELEEEQLDTLLDLSILDYGMYVQDWLIENQWAGVAGINISEVDLASAFLTRSLDFETSFTYAYSKIAGLQAGGPWELKKDFVMLAPGQQIYQIPKCREVNEVLWFARAELDSMMIDPFLGGFGGMGGIGMGGGMGGAQMGVMGSYYMMPAFDILLRMQDRNIKNRLIGGELTYRITAGPEGTKFLHLYSTPGGRFDFGNMERNDWKVWYWYYETCTDRDNCLSDNPDVVRLPSDVPLDDIQWNELNSPARAWVRRYFFASCKETLGRVRGKYQGVLKVPDADLTMDWDTLLTEAKDEKSKLIEELMARLERLRNDKMLERKALEAESLNKSLGYRPMNPGSIYVI
tara:strand:+ start:3386 stop:4504 length:1119 start_codon:yes stop_codon:yes gene_type:complete